MSGAQAKMVRLFVTIILALIGAPSLSLAAPADGDPLLQRILAAEQLISSGKADQAQTILMEVTQASPTNARALFNLAKIYEKRKDFEKAIDYMSASVANAPNNIVLLEHYAAMLVSADKKDEALTVARGLLEKNPTREQRGRVETLVSMLQADISKREKNYDKAIAQYKEVLKQFPTDTRILNGLGNAYALAEQWENAEQTLLLSIELDPDSSIPYQNLMRMYYSLGDRESIALLLQNVKDRDPNGRLYSELYDAIVTIGSNYIKDQNYEKALNEFLLLTTIDPLNPVAILATAEINEVMGRDEEASRIFKRIVSLKPNNPDFQYQLAGIYFGKGLDEKAIEVYQGLLNAKLPQEKMLTIRFNLQVLYGRLAHKLSFDILKNTSAQNNSILELVTSWVDQGQCGASIRVLLVLRSYASNTTQVNSLLEECYFQTEKYIEASVYTERMIAAKVNIDYWRQRYAELLFLAGEYDKAEKEYIKLKKTLRNNISNVDIDRTLELINIDRAVSTGGYSTAIRDRLLSIKSRYGAEELLDQRLAKAFLHLGDAKNAANVLEDWVKRNTGRRSTYYILASIYQKQGEQKKAHATIERLILIDPLSRFGGEVWETLYGNELFTLINDEKYLQARKILESDLDEDPMNVRGMLINSLTYLAGGERDKAKAEIDQVLQLEPSNSSARLLRAHYYIITDQSSLALDDFQLLFDIVTDDSVRDQIEAKLKSIYFVLGKEYEKKGKYDRALAIYSGMSKRLLYDPDAFLSLARLSLLQRRYADAHRYIDKALDLGGVNVNVYVASGDISQSEGDYGKASNAYLKALSYIEVENDSTKVLVNAYRVSHWQSVSDSMPEEWSISELEGMLEVEPNRMVLAQLLAVTYLRVGRFNDAVIQLERVVSAEPGNARARMQLAYAYERLDEIEKALAQFREVLLEKNDQNILIEAQSELNRLEGKLNLYAYRFFFASGQEWYYFPGAGRDVSYSRSLLRFDIQSQFSLFNYTKLNIGIFPQYTILHSGTPSDSFDPRYEASVAYSGLKHKINGSIAYSESRNVLLDQANEGSWIGSLSYSTDIKFPLYMESAENYRSKTIGFSASQTQRVTEGLVGVKTDSLALSAFLTIPTAVGGSMTVTLGHRDVIPKGGTSSDYGQVSDSITVAVLQSMTQYFYGGLTLEYRGTRNRDYDLYEKAANNIDVRRTTENTSVGLNVVYRLHQKMNFGFDYTISTQKSNLATSPSTPLSITPYTATSFLASLNFLI